MNILLDLTHIPAEKTGVGIYATNIVNSMAELKCNNDFFIMIQDDEDSFSHINKTNINFIKIKSIIFRKLIFRFILEQLIIPLIIIKYKIDLVHSFHYSFPLISFNAKRVVTIHDMIFYLYPEYHEKIKIYYFRLFIWLSARLADKVITVSKSTYNDLNRIIRINRKKIVVIHLGRPKWDALPINKKLIEDAKNKYGIKGDYFIYMGTIEPRKNLNNLIKGFHGYLLAGNEQYQLLICGKNGWKNNQLFSSDSNDTKFKNVRFTGFIDEKDKPYLIKGSKLFLYLSQYEGFGLPILEAMSLGVPTITSNISSMPEIAGDACIKINPNDIESISLNIEKLMTNEALYKKLHKLSLGQAYKFDWDKTAKKTLQLYNEFEKRY